MKSILPSMKESNRYLAFQTDKRIPFKDIKLKIDKLFKEQVGSIGLAKANLKLIENLFQGNKGVITISPKFVNELIFSLALSEDPKFQTLGVSGIDNKTKRFLNKQKEGRN